MSKSEVEYKRSIASHLNVDQGQVDLYWKGRVALFALLKSLDIGKGDEVIMPAFTCVVVPNAVIYLGATPVYVDVSTETLNTRLKEVRRAVTRRTKCILVQNTFGLSSSVSEIVEFAKEKSIFTIEDCTHGFGGTYKGKMNGTYCDAAFYSTQWNKPFSTGVGGFSLLNNRKYQETLSQVNSKLTKPGSLEKYMLSTLIGIKKYLLNDLTYWTAIKFYRKLSKMGVVVGSSQDIEIVSTKQPEHYFLGSTSVQNNTGIKELKKLNSVIDQRIKNGKIFNSFFKKNNLWHYLDKDLDNHSFLKYPIFVKDKSAFKAKAEKAKVRLGDWFVSPIHPVEEDLDLWRLEISSFPVAVELSNAILNLTTENKDISKTLRFLEQNLDDFIIPGR